jgi:ElaA protein
MVSFKLKHFDDLTPFELYDLLQLRQEIFAVEQDCVYQDNDNYDQYGWHLMGYDQAGICCYTRLIGPNLIYSGATSIGRVVNHIRNRGKGFGKELMKVSIARIQNLFPGYPIKISAQTYLKKFYEDLGFSQIGEGYLEDGIPHIPMILE